MWFRWDTSAAFPARNLPRRWRCRPNRIRGRTYD
jgi:hypothetical protein